MTIPELSLKIRSEVKTTRRPGQLIVEPRSMLVAESDLLSYSVGAWEHAMSKAIAVLGSALFFVIAPLVLAGFVPWWITQWEFRPAFSGVDLTRILGGILIIVGVPGLVDSFARFALEGLGTPAPLAPTQKLVVTGLYRYVRNPIYIAVVAVIFGQALLLGDWRLLWYGALLWLFFHVFVVMYEEPTLKQTFGTEYESFQTNVPRWIPRLTPWRAA
jgi:protein-S-isoprenylcysteine O-methyltransferase Ste14